MYGRLVAHARERERGTESERAQGAWGDQTGVCGRGRARRGGHGAGACALWLRGWLGVGQPLESQLSSIYALRL